MNRLQRFLLRRGENGLLARFLSLVLSLLWVAFAAEVRGDLITFEFTGSVTSVSVRNVDGLQDFDFPDVGDPFTGFYTFDSNSFRTDPDGASGVTILPDRAVGVTIGEFQFEGPAIFVGTSPDYNGTTQDYYDVFDYIPSIELTSHPALAEILDRNDFLLEIRGQNLFPDPNILPLIPPSLIGAEARSLVMHMDNQFNSFLLPYVTILGTLDSLTVVPEPSSLLLMGIALMLLLQNR